MKAIIVMYDSLNRHFLPPYGNDWVRAPNFQRLADRVATFETSFIGSAPTIPARRELHTGRYNFLHRSWGPLEPFDDSLPQILRQNGVYTHLVTDCAHYWEDGGSTYHGRYMSHEFSRGQEGDAWKADVRAFPKNICQQDVVNRRYMMKEKDFPQSRTFANGLEFLKTNRDADKWLLQIETFDPHEPYHSPPKYKRLYPRRFKKPIFDWPVYRPNSEQPGEVEQCRLAYAALVSFCDASLGKVLDAMDEWNLWQDTMLIVNTDHGFLLGEHGWCGKMAMPFYNEIARTPLFIWDPRSRVKGERRKALVQTIDLPATLLEYFGVPAPADMQGKPLKEAVAEDKPVREAALFGQFRKHVNCVDGRYVYMRGPATPENSPIAEYTMMPTHMRQRFTPQELAGLDLAGLFAFTKGCKVMRIPLGPGKADGLGNLLFDLETDSAQEQPIQDSAAEAKMIEHMRRLLKDSDAPPEQFERLGL
ncbi:MAG: sulfatase [Candidatus Sumerlaeota bacterium]|nr:sulfatase [Candidatus Sumerlaeota bacterium]